MNWNGKNREFFRRDSFLRKRVIRISKEIICRYNVMNQPNN